MGLLSIFHKDNEGKDGIVKNPGDSLTFYRTPKNGTPAVSSYDAENDVKTTSVFYKNKEVQTISRPRKK